jgi:hypothetical protein
MAAAEDMLWPTTMMTTPLMMPFIQGILFSMHLAGELARDSGSMSLGTSLLRGSHCGSNRTVDNGGAEYMLCLMTTTMMTTPLMMPFALGVLFSMLLVDSQESQVVCH